MKLKSLLASLFVVLAVPVAGSATTDVPHVVVGDEVIEGGVHLWDYPVVVSPGASLTLRDATVHLDWDPPVCFTGTAGYCHPAVMVLPGGTLNIVRSTLDSPSWDVADFGSGFVIAGVGATFSFEDSTFYHFKSIGSQGPGIARSSITGSTFDWALSALGFSRGAEADISGNTFSNALSGVTVQDSSANISDNHFTNVVRTFGTTTGRAIDIQGSIVGEKAFETLPIVEGNVIENGANGILSVSGFPHILRNNIIRNNAIGMVIGISVGDQTIHHDAPLATGNTLDGNQNSVIVYYSGVTYQGMHYLNMELHGNSIVNSGCHDLDARSGNAKVVLTVNATNNWWGSAAGPLDNGPDCEAIKGVGITVDPWLTAAP